MKNLIKNKNAIYIFAAFLAFIFSSISANAQDIDTLEWEEIVDLSDTVFHFTSQRLYLYVFYKYPLQ